MEEQLQLPSTLLCEGEEKPEQVELQLQLVLHLRLWRVACQAGMAKMANMANMAVTFQAAPMDLIAMEAGNR